MQLLTDYEFEAFSSRKSFNRNLKHFKSVNEIVASIEAGKNLADFLQSLVDNSQIESNQFAPILRALLVEKYNYEFLSLNLKATTTADADLAKEFIAWKAVDLVLAYHHPESGLVILNPKNERHWNTLGELKKNEFVTVYVGGLSKTSAMKMKNARLFNDVLEVATKLLNGGKVKTPAAFFEGSFAYKVPVVTTAKPKKPSSKKPATRSASKKSVTSAPKVVEISSLPAAKPSPVAAPAPAPVRQVATSSGRLTVSPKVPVLVTNELFHNGNVEAWKRIIESYSAKYKANRITVYYEGEIIHDINSLFKWGKVKHGTSIIFSVSSPEEKIADLSKLRKYFLEGASPRFEVFLKGAPGKILELF